MGSVNGRCVCILTTLSTLVRWQTVLQHGHLLPVSHLISIACPEIGRSRKFLLFKHRQLMCTPPSLQVQLCCCNWKNPVTVSPPLLLLLSRWDCKAQRPTGLHSGRKVQDGPGHQMGGWSCRGSPLRHNPRDARQVQLWFLRSWR